MKRVGDLMSELGFNAQASTSVKEAFLKHLIKTSTGICYETPTEKKDHQVTRPSNRKLSEPSEVQLSFDFEKLNPGPGQRSA